MKSFAAHAVRHLVRAQAQLMGVSIDLSNQIRSGLKIFGLVAGKGEGRAPAFRVRELLDGRPALAAIIDPLLAAWRVVREQIAVLDRRLIKIAHSSTQSRTMHLCGAARYSGCIAGRPPKSRQTYPSARPSPFSLSAPRPSTLNWRTVSRQHR